MSTKVLVVDDAPFVRTMIKDILTASGRYEVVGEAANGREAISRFQELQPEMITMDIMMPVMDGIEATREIVRLDPGAKIVICSSLGQEPLVIESIAAGARDFFVKPLTSEKILKVLDQVARTK